MILDDCSGLCLTWRHVAQIVRFNIYARFDFQLRARAKTEFLLLFISILCRHFKRENYGDDNDGSIK